MRPVLWPSEARPTARFTETVVLPTPPLPEPTAIRFFTPGIGNLGGMPGWLGVIATIVATVDRRAGAQRRQSRSNSSSKARSLQRTHETRGPKEPFRTSWGVSFPQNGQNRRILASTSDAVLGLAMARLPGSHAAGSAGCAAGRDA